MRMPAEWEPHERTLMGWPCRADLWGETMDQARADYAAVANAIAAFEPVTMIANPGDDAAAARAACSSGVEVVELPLDDSWLRDCGPIYVYGDDGRRRAVRGPTGRAELVAGVRRVPLPDRRRQTVGRARRPPRAAPRAVRRPE